jgi:large subunit ribosomal protein L10
MGRRIATIVLGACAAAAAAATVTVSAFAPSVVLPSAPSTATRLHGGSSAFASSLEGKKATIEKVKGLLDTSDLIFSIPAGSMTVSQQQKLCNTMPQGTTIKVIKNKLMARAVDGTPYEAAANMLKGPNMWFFIEDDIKGTMTAYKDFLKESNKKETHPILGGVMEATLYDTDGIEAIGQLPTKSELYAKIAASIQAVPTKVARVIKAPGSKLARAIKLATMPENKD